MSFFNQKEEVIDLQLTQYGKHLLSKGLFKPTFYAFYDNDILYDSEYIGLIEDQNTIKTRIKDQTPRNKTQYLYHGLENDFLKISEKDKENVLKSNKLQATPEKSFALAMPLGNSAFDSDYLPAWNINYLNGELSSSTIVTPYSASQPTINIPQLESTITYKIIRDPKPIVHPLNQPDPDGVGLDHEAFNHFYFSESPEFLNSENPDEVLFGDGTRFIIEGEYLLLELIERNTTFETKNFDIEIYEVENVTGSNGKIIERYLPLIMPIPPDELSGNEDELLEKLPDIGPDYVEYYLDFLVDDEIPPGIICKSKELEKTQNIFSDSLVDCPEKTGISVKLYSTDAEGDDVC